MIEHEGREGKEGKMKIWRKEGGKVGGKTRWKSSLRWRRRFLLLALFHVRVFPAPKSSTYHELPKRLFVLGSQLQDLNSPTFFK
jgi:hypothetical protein